MSKEWLMKSQQCEEDRPERGLQEVPSEVQQINFSVCCVTPSQVNQKQNKVIMGNTLHSWQVNSCMLHTEWVRGELSNSKNCCCSAQSFSPTADQILCNNVENYSALTVV